MTRTRFWIATVVAAGCVALSVMNVVLARANGSVQAEVNARQQYVQQSAQLEVLYREIVRALAELAARAGDDDVRAMLARHGITYTVNAQPGGATAPPSVAPSGTARR